MKTRLEQKVAQLDNETSLLINQEDIRLYLLDVFKNTPDYKEEDALRLVRAMLQQINGEPIDAQINLIKSLLTQTAPGAPIMNPNDIRISEVADNMAKTQFQLLYLYSRLSNVIEPPDFVHTDEEGWHPTTDPELLAKNLKKFQGLFRANLAKQLLDLIDKKNNPTHDVEVSIVEPLNFSANALAQQRHYRKWKIYGPASSLALTVLNLAGVITVAQTIGKEFDDIEKNAFVFSTMGVQSVGLFALMGTYIYGQLKESQYAISVGRYEKFAEDLREKLGERQQVLLRSESSSAAGLRQFSLLAAPQQRFESMRQPLLDQPDLSRVATSSPRF